MATVAAYRIEPGGGLTPLYVEGVIAGDNTVDPLAGGFAPSTGGPVEPPPPPTGLRDPHRDRVFAVDSPFNLPLATGVTFKSDASADNALWISRANAAPSGGVAQVNGQSTGYSIPIVDVTGMTLTEAPVVTLTHASTGTPFSGASGVIRIPVDTMPPAGLDGSIHVRMPNGQAWDVYRAVKLSNTAWTSTSVDAIDIYGSGIVRGVAAANNALLGGMILQSELADVRDGVRDDFGHALRISLPATMLGPDLPDPGFQWPANTRDNPDNITYSGQIRMGALLAIPDEAEALAAVSAAGLYVRALANTLARYGTYVEDKSDYVALYVEPNWRRNPATNALTAPAAYVTTAEGQMKNAWRDHLMKRCRVVSNSAAVTPGGGAIDATRRAPLAPALAAWA